MTGDAVKDHTPNRRLDFRAMLSRAAATTRTARPPTTARVRRSAIGVVQRLRPHWLLVALVAVGAGLRLLTMVAYPPALFFSDSWAYLSTAFAHHLVSLPYLRPAGYSILIRVLTIPGRDVTQLVALQHIAGLTIGTLVYAALVRARIPRGLAAAASALVLLDAYAITLEQYVMPDTFFALTLLTAALLLAWPRLELRHRQAARTGTRTCAVAGFLLAAAAVQREVGLFAIPVVALYLVWIRVGWRPFLAFLVTLAVPLSGYSGLMDAKTGVFGLTTTSGWTLYSRVAGFADCSGAGIARAALPLCESAQERESHPSVPDWYMWGASSPAIRLFHRGHETKAQRARDNAILGAFARRVILHQPGDYVSAVVGDFLRYFTPGTTPYADSRSATSLPTSAAREAVDASIRRRVIPSAHPSVQSPAGFMHGYRAVVHVPRPILALLGLAVLLALALRTPARREVLLFGGTALILLLGTSATGGFGLRYLLPTVPLFLIGGGLAARDLAAWRHSRLAPAMAPE